MLITVPPENLERVMAVFEKEDVTATAIGKLTTERRLQLNFNGEKVADMDMTFLFNPMQKHENRNHRKTNFHRTAFS